MLRARAADGGSQCAKYVGGGKRVDLVQLVEIDYHLDQARMLNANGAAGQCDDFPVIFRLEKRLQAVSTDQSRGAGDQCGVLGHLRFLCYPERRRTLEIQMDRSRLCAGCMEDSGGAAVCPHCGW